MDQPALVPARALAGTTCSFPLGTLTATMVTTSEELWPRSSLSDTEIWVALVRIPPVPPERWGSRIDAALLGRTPPRSVARRRSSACTRAGRQWAEQPGDRGQGRAAFHDRHQPAPAVGPIGLGYRSLPADVLAPAGHLCCVQGC